MHQVTTKYGTANPRVPPSKQVSSIPEEAVNRYETILMFVMQLTRNPETKVHCYVLFLEDPFNQQFQLLTLPGSALQWKKALPKETTSRALVLRTKQMIDYISPLRWLQQPTVALCASTLLE